MKDNKKMVAKVNKEIGGWDYRGYHIDRIKALKVFSVAIDGNEVVAKTLGEAKEIIDEVIDTPKTKTETKTENEIEFTSKRGVFYLLSIIDGKIKAFTYDENGKKTYWNVTREIERFIATR